MRFELFADGLPDAGLAGATATARIRRVSTPPDEAELPSLPLTLDAATASATLALSGAQTLALAPAPATGERRQRQDRDRRQDRHGRQPGSLLLRGRPRAMGGGALMAEAQTEPANRRTRSTRARTRSRFVRGLVRLPGLIRASRVMWSWGTRTAHHEIELELVDAASPHHMARVVPIYGITKITGLWARLPTPDEASRDAATA